MKLMSYLSIPVILVHASGSLCVEEVDSNLIFNKTVTYN